VSKIKALVALSALVIVALAATATAANASLPSILLLEGTAAEVKAESTTAKTEFHGSVTIKGEGYKFPLSVTENMVSLGKNTLWFLKVSLNGVPCNSLGDTAGNVLVPVEWHLVLALGGGASLFLIVFLVTPTLDFDCGSILVFLSGSSIVHAEKFKVDTTAFTAETGKCTGTSPAFKEYDNDKEEMATAKLTAEISEIKGTACEEVNEGAAFALTSSAMLEVMEP
jgi:hypothetical protein